MDDGCSMRAGADHLAGPHGKKMGRTFHLSRSLPSVLGSVSHPSNASISGATTLIFRDENGISVRLESSRTERKRT